MGWEGTSGSWAGGGANDSDLLQSGIEALRGGRAAEAIAPLERFVAAQPENFEGNNFLGVALAQAGRAPEAIAHLTKATRLNPQSAAAQYNLGLAHLNVHDTEAARTALHHALQLDPSHQGARQALTRVPGGADGASASAPTVQNSMPSTSAFASGAAAPALAANASAEGSPWSTSAATTSSTLEPTQSTRLTAADMLRAGAFGLGAAILGAVVWDKIVYHTNYQIGIIAVGIGIAVGAAVAAGAQGKRGRSLQIMGALLACFAMLLGQALIVMDQSRDIFSAMGMSPDPVRLFLFSVRMVPRVLADDPLSLIFIAFGVWQGWAMPGATPDAKPADATASGDASAPAESGSEPKPTA